MWCFTSPAARLTAIVHTMCTFLPFVFPANISHEKPRTRRRGGRCWAPLYCPPLIERVSGPAFYPINMCLLILNSGEIMVESGGGMAKATGVY